MHKVGTVYRVRGTFNHLCTFNLNKKDYAVLMSLEGDGNRWTEPVEVTNPYQITEQEMKLITGGADYELWKGKLTINEHYQRREPKHINLNKCAMKELKDMTSTELATYKASLYILNTDNGNIKKLAQICRLLGSRLNHSYGPKFRFTEGNIEIYVDDYGGYMTVHVGGKLRVSTHNERLYAIGEWEEIIDRLWPKAEELENQKDCSIEQTRKQDLLDQLT